MSVNNQIQLIGNIGQDPIFKQLESGTNVINFSLATNESYTDKSGEKVQKTLWHNLVAWGKTAEIINQYVKKGDKILIQGKLSYNEYEKDGIKIKSAEIVVNEIQFFSKNQ